MKKYIQINSNGIITTVTEPTEDLDITMYPSIKVIDTSLSNAELLENYYYDEHLNALVSLPAKPAGVYEWLNKSWVVNTEKLLQDIKHRRWILLQATDWTQLPDVTFSDSTKAAWQLYRQQLRDLPSTLTGNETSLEDINWPTAP